MKLQIKQPLIRAISLLATLFLSNTIHAESALKIEQIHQRLFWELPPLVTATINTDFKFDVSPFLSMPKPEITFKLSSKDTILKHVVISDLPNGLVQNTESSDACFKHFRLGVKDACYLHLEVNKREYDASAENNLSVCWNDNNDCLSISKEQLNEAVENTDDFIHVEVSPMSIDGLQWDPTEFAIVGKPTKMEGDYLFQLKVIAHDGTTDSTTLPVYINDFSKNVFRFNDNINLPVATPGKEYKINLLELIGRSPPGKSSFQVHFKINRDPECPEWLKLEKNYLKSNIPLSEAGNNITFTLLAFTNKDEVASTQITIPVASDPTRKPILKEASWDVLVDKTLGIDLHSLIIDNGGDDKVSFLIDEISPKELSYYLFNNGFFRVDTVYKSYGKIYYITLHANTRLGGNSEPITIPLEITANPELAPSFIRNNLVIPMYSGQSLIHDFVANQDIVPFYEQIPYSVSFADTKHPSWMKIENNKLMIDEVPKNCDSLYKINLTLTNEPGGSRQTELSLMCSK